MHLVNLPVDDDSRDVLVHEDEDGAEEGGDGGHDDGPPGVVTQRRDQPGATRPRRGKLQD